MSESNFLHLHCDVCDWPLYLFVEPEPLTTDVCALCSACAKTHEIRVEPIDPGPAAEQE